MKNHVLVACAGMAVCSADAQVRPELQQAQFSGRAYHAIRATAITGLTVDGQYVYGRTIELGDGGNTDARGTGDIAYDSFWGVDTDGDGFDDPICGDQAGTATLTAPSSRWFFGTSFSIQSISEDASPADVGQYGGVADSVAFAGVFPISDGGNGTVSEVCQMVMESWEVIDNFPDLDGSDGFQPDANGNVSPFYMTDTDGDGFVDQFVGGVVLTFANTDTDGDGVPDQLLSFGALGYGTFFASSLSSLGVSLPSGLDVAGGGFDTNGDPIPDGIPDAGGSARWTRGAIDTDGDGLPDGPLRGGFFPSTRSSFMLWGTASAAPAAAACLSATGVANIGGGATDGIVWAEGENMLGDTAGDWSGGGNSPMVDERHDPSFDVSDFFNLVTAPNPTGWMCRVNVASGGITEDCCDINADGMCTAADFSAWIAAFNAATGRCDVNQDGMCTAADFSAWIAAFNNSTAGMPDQCVFLP